MTAKTKKKPRTAPPKTAKRWPMPMRDLLAKYPASKNVVQVRVASHDGDVVTFEGQCTKAIADALMEVMFGLAVREVSAQATPRDPALDHVDPSVQAAQ